MAAAQQTGKSNQPSSKRWLVGLLISVLLLIGALVVYVLFRKKRTSQDESSTQPEANQNPETIKEFLNLVIETIPDIDIENAKYVTAQAMHETGVFNSKVYNENNNAFGMRLAKIRDTSAIGEQFGYAMYESVQDSIFDLYLWFQYHKQNIKFDGPVSYCEFLKQKAFFEADQAAYTLAVTNHLKKI